MAADRMAEPAGLTASAAALAAEREPPAAAAAEAPWGMVAPPIQPVAARARRIAFPGLVQPDLAGARAAAAQPQARAAGEASPAAVEGAVAPAAISQPSAQAAAVDLSPLRPSPRGS